MEVSDIGSIGWVVMDAVPSQYNNQDVLLRLDAYRIIKGQEGEVGLDEQHATFENPASHMATWFEMDRQLTGNRATLRSLISLMNQRKGDYARIAGRTVPVTAPAGDEIVSATFEGATASIGSVVVSSLHGIAVVATFEPRVKDITLIIVQTLSEMFEEQHPAGIVAATA